MVVASNLPLQPAFPPISWLTMTDRMTHSAKTPSPRRWWPEIILSAFDTNTSMVLKFQFSLTSPDNIDFFPTPNTIPWLFPDLEEFYFHPGLVRMFLAQAKFPLEIQIHSWMCCNVITTFALRCGIAEKRRTLICISLNNKRITKQYICYMPCSFKLWINFPQSRTSLNFWD